jgi:hypothetical protein
MADEEGRGNIISYRKTNWDRVVNSTLENPPLARVPCG